MLMYSHPLSQNGKARLQVMREHDNGFAIAEKDLEIRGPGEVLGTRQTGLMQFKMADLQRDAKWLEAVKSFCEKVPVDSPFAKAISERWLSGREVYGEV